MYFIKGLDFPNIQHVINFDMPEEIENYVHRIGRTGRSGKTGISTTYINRSIEEAQLLDLKHLLMEAKQKIPEFLAEIGADLEAGTGEVYSVNFTLLELLFLVLDFINIRPFFKLELGCTYCGGLGHRITNCPKLESQQSKTASNLGRTEFIAKGSGDW